MLYLSIPYFHVLNEMREPTSCKRFFEITAHSTSECVQQPVFSGQCQFVFWADLLKIIWTHFKHQTLKAVKCVNIMFLVTLSVTLWSHSAQSHCRSGQCSSQPVREQWCSETLLKIILTDIAYISHLFL